MRGRATGSKAIRPSPTNRTAFRASTWATAGPAQPAAARRSKTISAAARVLTGLRETPPARVTRRGRLHADLDRREYYAGVNEDTRPGLPDDALCIRHCRLTRRSISAEGLPSTRKPACISPLRIFSTSFTATRAGASTAPGEVLPPIYATSFSWKLFDWSARTLACMNA